MYVLKGTSRTDPAAPFTFVGKLNTPDDNWAIDGTGTFKPSIQFTVSAPI